MYSGLAIDLASMLPQVGTLLGCIVNWVLGSHVVKYNMVAKKAIEHWVFLALTFTGKVGRFLVKQSCIIVK